MLSLNDLVESVVSISNHQKNETIIWFGYLDGWMLCPQEEVLFRKIIRTFPCILVSHFPLSLSQAWKNEIDVLHTQPL
jgi:hypothetical protein